jgi:hypothetical protein
VDLFPNWVVLGFFETSSFVGLENMDYLWGEAVLKRKVKTKERKLLVMKKAPKWSNRRHQ